MAERFSVLRHEKSLFWSKGCPLLLLSHAITKDNTNDNVFAQLKFENRDTRRVKAVYVTLRCADTLAQPVGDAVSFAYLDLDAECCTVFGDKKAVPLPAEARSFTLSVDKILFADETLWQGKGVFEAFLPDEQQPISSLGDLADQYRRELGAVNTKHRCLPLTGDGYFCCGCGEVLVAGETRCKACGAVFADLLPLSDPTYLAEKKAQFEAEQAEKAARDKEAAEKAAAEKAAQQKKTKKALMKAIIAALVIAALAAGYVFALKPMLQKNKYADAKELFLAEDYAAAGEKFKSLDDYEDARDYYLYSSAMQNVENGTYADAATDLSAISNWSAPDLPIDPALLLSYCEGHQAFADQDYESASTFFTQVGDILDSKDMVLESNYLHAYTLANSTDASSLYNAMIMYASLDGYKDSDALASETASRYINKASSSGDGLSLSSSSFIKAVELLPADDPKAATYRSYIKMYGNTWYYDGLASGGDPVTYKVTYALKEGKLYATVILGSYDIAKGFVIESSGAYPYSVSSSDYTKPFVDDLRWSKSNLYLEGLVGVHPMIATEKNF